MPGLTPNINLKKPLLTEAADIEVINENMDIIDSEIAKVRDSAKKEHLADLFTNGIIPNTLNELRITETDVPSKAIKIDTGKVNLEGIVYTYNTQIIIDIDPSDALDVINEPHTTDESGALTLTYFPVCNQAGDELAAITDIVVTKVSDGSAVNVITINPESGEVTTDALNESVQINYKSFSNRMDVTYIDADGTLKVLKGNPVLPVFSPVVPMLQEGTFRLGEINLSSNFSTVTNAMIKKHDVFYSINGLEDDFNEVDAQITELENNKLDKTFDLTKCNILPKEAYWYVLFKNKLTAPEIIEIEGNPNFMDIINNSEIAKMLDSIGVSNMYMYGYTNGGAKNAIIDGDTTLTDTINCYRDLTIDSGAQLYVAEKTPTLLIVTGTLTLNGTISAVGKGGKGGSQSPAGKGGDGGGVIIILVNEIVGTGTIDASGLDGSSPTGCPSDGYQKDPKSGEGGRLGGDTLVVGSDMYDRIPFNYPFVVSDTGASGGASGGYDTDGSSQYPHSFVSKGGNGGSSFTGSGGSGGSASGSDTCSAGGGGGGGLIVVYSPKPVPAINLYAKGGNGGNANSAGEKGGGGGGGCGGRIVINAPSASANIDISYGIGGNGYSGSNGGNGNAGYSRFNQL